MNKKFLVFLLLITSVSSVIFAVDKGMSSSVSLKEDMKDPPSVVAERQLEEYEKARPNLGLDDNVNLDMNKSNAVVMSLAAKIEGFMRNIKIMLLGTFVSDNGMGKADSYVNGSSATTSDVNLNGVSVNNVSRSRGYVVFRLLLAIWLVLSTMWYCVKIVLDPNFQKIQIIYMLLKAILITAIYFMLPYIGEYIITGMWRLAEYICGEEVGTMSYTTALTSNVNTFWFWTLLTFGSISGVLGIGILGLGSGIIGGTGATISPLLFGLALGGVMATFGISVAYMTWGLELYVAIYVMMFYLPMTLFEGFGYKITTVFKFFILNALEIFIGAILIMMVNKMSDMDVLNVGIEGTIGNNFDLKTFLRGGGSVQLIEWISQFLLPPLVLSILMPVTGKIVRSLIDGSGLTESTQDAYGQVKTMTQYIGMGTALGTLKQKSKTQIPELKHIDTPWSKKHKEQE